MKEHSMDVDILCIEGSYGQAYHHQLEHQGFNTQRVSTGREALIVLKGMSVGSVKNIV